MINVYIENVRPSWISKEDKIPCLWATSLYYRILMYLKINNCNIICDFYNADYVLLNTCSVSDNYEKYITDKVNNIKKYNKWIKKVIIFWCLAVEWNDLYKIVDDIIPLKEGSRLDKYFWFKILFKDVSYFESSKFFNKNIFFKQNSYYLNIWRWCIHNCSYCWIKKWIWYIESRELISIYKEVNIAIKNWFKRFKIITDDLWSYWQDIDSNFIELIDKILDIDQEIVIDISNMEPSQLIKYFNQFSKKINQIKSIVLPVQSFNNRLLNSMNRKYSVDDYIKLIYDIKKINNDIDIQNHIIYWYPWETLEDFVSNIYISVKLPIQTAFLEFQDRKWTVANMLPNKLSWNELSIRKKILQKFKKLYPKKIWG